MRCPCLSSVPLCGLPAQAAATGRGACHGPKSTATSLVTWLSWAACVIAAASLWSSAAQAQALRACRTDVPLVLQPSTCLADPNIRSAPPPAPVAEARPAKKTLEEILRERDGERPRYRTAPESRPDGAQVLKARMGAV